MGYLGNKLQGKYHKDTFQTAVNMAWPAIVESFFIAFAGLVDSLMVSSLGSYAVAAVGLTTQPKLLGLAFFFALNVSISALVARRRGEQRQGAANETLVTALVFIILAAAAFSIGFVAFASPIIHLCGSTAETHNGAVTYFRIIMGGMIFNCIQMGINSAQRGAGNTKITMRTNVTSNTINIILNYLLINGHFGFPALGIQGAALATVVSQLLSGGLCAWWFFTRVEGIAFTKENTRFSPAHCKRLAVVGLPMGFEYSVSAIGAVIMQDAINLMGSVVVAAQTAGEKIRQMFTLPMESVGMAMATYVGQNHGAGRNDRIRQGIRDGCLIQIVYSAAAWLVIWLIKPFAVGLVLGDADPAVTAGALDYLAVISTLFVILGFLMIFRNTLQGLGYSTMAVVSGVGELIGRSFGGWLALHGLGFLGISLANPIAWGFALCYCVFMVTRMLRKEDKLAL